MSREHPFPLVECDDHPGIVEPGYAVCIHVVRDGAPVAHFVRATDTALGEVLCIGCSRESEVSPGNLLLSCAPGVRESGWDKVTVQ